MVSSDSPNSQIRTLLGSVNKIDVSDQIVRTRALGEELDFSDCESMFVEFQELASVLSEVAWETLPHATQMSVLASIRNLQKAYFAINKFAAAEGDNTRAQLAIEFEQRLDEFKERAIPYAGYLLWKASGVERRANTLLQGIEESFASISGKEEEIEGIRADFASVLAATRVAGTQVGASTNAETFHSAAIRYESRARRWLQGSICSALVTIVVGILVVFVWNSVNEFGTAAAVQAVFGRTVVLAVLSFATVTAVRMYRSNAHLAVVNRHREDALRTFRTFVEGTDAPETKNQILLAAAHAAFGQTSTGLIGERADGGNTLEVFEGLFGRSMRGS